jgi:hypothetical protein
MERHTHDASDITRPVGSGFNVGKIIGILGAIGLVRAIASHKLRGRGFGPMGAGDGGGGRWAGRRAAIADFHRQMHAHDAQTAEATAASDATGDATA